MDRQVHRNLITAEDKAAALARMTTSTDYAAFGDCDLVIEAATEKEEVKKADLPHAAAAYQAVLHDRLEHLVDLDHPARRRHRPARASSSACTS